MAEQIRIFKRSVWKRNKDWPGGWEPKGDGRKTTVKFTDSIEEAREICCKHNNQRKSQGEPFCEFEHV